jgi:uncharacterized delta-60 repeat protein
MHPLSVIRIFIRAGLLLAAFPLLPFRAHAAPGDVDLSFDAGFFPGPPVAALHAVAVQPDGKVIIAGAGIVRLNADGSEDLSFTRPVDPNIPVGMIQAVALQPDGKVLVAHADGVSRLNADGSWDTGFVSPTIVDENLFGTGLRALALQADGKILIGGEFNFVNGHLRSGLARLNSNGSLDTSFVPATGANDFTGVYSIAVQPDGKVLIGGQLLTWRIDSVARLNADGSLDGNFFSVKANDYGPVFSLALQPDGKVLIGGIFSSIDDTDRPGFARLNADGSLDLNYNPGTGVKTFAAQADGKVLVGGSFLTIGGASVNGLIRLNADGSIDRTFHPELSPHPSLFGITLLPDGKVLLNGPDVTGNVPPDYNLLTRLHTDGSRDATFIAGKNRGGGARWLMALPDGKFLIGGRFPFIDGINLAGIARLNADGSLDRILSTSTELGNDRIIPLPDGKWLAGKAAVRFNADWTVDATFTAPVTDNQIGAVAVQSDGRVVIAGSFTAVNGTNRNGIARLNTDGTVDTTFVAAGFSQFSNGFSSLAVQPDGKVLAGGEFSSADQAHQYGIVRLNTNGSLDSTFDPVFAENGVAVPVQNIVLQPDGKVLITGAFTFIRGVRHDYIARLNANGSLDNGFDPGFVVETGAGVSSNPGAITLQPDGRLLVLGDYHLGNDRYIQGIYRLGPGGIVDPAFDVSGGLPFNVNAVAAQPDGRILISGSFLSVKGVTRPYLARLYGDFVPSLPHLSITHSDPFVILSWPTSALNLQLQETTNLSLLSSWAPVAQPVVTSAGQVSVTVPMTAGQEFFRLKLQ